MQHKAKRRRKVREKLLSKMPVRLFLALLSTAIMLIVASCGNPYALKVGSLNYTGPQQSASIQFSDPQIYKREALINERREEMEYLNKLMQDSRSQNFEPELMRELEAISALSAQLGVKFDPAAAITYQRAVELGDLEQEIQTTKVQMQLAQVKRDLELLKEQLPEQKTPSAQPGQPSESVTSPPSGPTPPTKEDIKVATDRLEKLVGNVAARLDKESVAPRKIGVTASPRDQFLDRQAYRSEIRDALNATSLDELHDYQGNSLYRMQFHATVLPGLGLKGGEADKALIQQQEEALKNKLAILRMRLVPPQLDLTKSRDREVLEDLYLKWLGHVTSQLNLVGSDGEIRANQALLQLGATGVYFDILEYQVPKSEKIACEKGPVFGNPNTQNCHIIRIALPPGIARDVKENYDTSKNQISKAKIQEALTAGLSFVRKKKESLSPGAPLPNYLSLSTGQDGVRQL